MSVEDNKRVIRRLLEEEGYTRDFGLIDRYIAPECTDHCVWANREGLKRILRAFLHVYQELDCSIEQIIAVCYRLDARHGEEHKTIAATVMFRLVNGRVAEHWGHSNSFF